MTASVPAYIVAARRTAMGRVGGLHRRRRIAELSAPLIGPVLKDAGLQPSEIDEVVIGNASESGNPARLVALSGGLPETVPGVSIDRGTASGLDAILAACHLVASGAANAVLAGGAESLSTAPWRIARPRSPHQLPQFIGAFEASVAQEAAPGESRETSAAIESEEAFARAHGISRGQQDAYALRDHLRATDAREHRRLSAEIVALRANAEETRDELAPEPTLEDLEELTPFLPPEGTLTPGNTSGARDGAALVAVVSQARWEALGRPRALRLVASRALGVKPGAEAEAPIAAARSLLASRPRAATAIACAELAESSAAQALAFAAELGLDGDMVNADGGAVTRGQAGGATGAVLVVRLFWRLLSVEAPVRGHAGPEPRGRLGLVALGARAGMGLAALFETVQG